MPFSLSCSVPVPSMLCLLIVLCLQCLCFRIYGFSCGLQHLTIAFGVIFVRVSCVSWLLIFLSFSFDVPLVYFPVPFLVYFPIQKYSGLCIFASYIPVSTWLTMEAVFWTSSLLYILTIRGSAESGTLLDPTLQPCLGTQQVWQVLFILYPILMFRKLQSCVTLSSYLEKDYFSSVQIVGFRYRMKFPIIMSNVQKP